MSILDDIGQVMGHVVNAVDTVAGSASGPPSTTRTLIEAQVSGMLPGAINNVQQSAGSGTTYIDQGSPFQQVVIPLNTPNIRTTGYVINIPGNRLVFQRFDSHPGANFTMVAGGQVRNFSPGMVFQGAFNQVTLILNTKITPNNGIAENSKAYFIVVKDASFDFKEPESLNQVYFEPINLIGGVFTGQPGAPYYSETTDTTTAENTGGFCVGSVPMYLQGFTKLRMNIGFIIPVPTAASVGLIHMPTIENLQGVYDDGTANTQNISVIPGSVQALVFTDYGIVAGTTKVTDMNGALQNLRNPPTGGAAWYTFDVTGITGLVWIFFFNPTAKSAGRTYSYFVQGVA